MRRSVASCSALEFAGTPRGVTWSDDSGVGPLEHVRSIERRKKPQGFLSASFSALKDELLWSFSRPTVSEPLEAEDASLQSLEEARQNAITNVHRVRALAASLS